MANIFGNLPVSTDEQAVLNSLPNLTGANPLTQGTQTNLSPSDSEFNSGANPIAAFNAILQNVDYSTSIMMRGLKIDRISSTSWNQRFPYRFLLLKFNGDKNTSSTSGANYQVLSSYVLPINPQDLTISEPFAIKTTVTSRGILEEHNGIPLKLISFTATTGILPDRESYSAANAPVPSVVQSIFAQTVTAAQTLVSAVKSVISTPQETTQQAQGTLQSGYFQYHLLRAFLEMYAHVKSKSNGRGYRLAFQSEKDNVVYLVTPNNFSRRRSVASPNEYIYSFQGTAWGTVDSITSSAGVVDPFSNLKIKTNDILDLIQRINNTRRVIQSTKDLLTAVKTDIETSIIQPMNNVVLALKEAAEIPKTALDLSTDLKNSLESSLTKALRDLPQDIANSLFPSGGFAAKSALNDLVQTNTDPTNFNVSTGAKSTILNNPDFLDSIQLNTLFLSPEAQSAINDSINNALLTTNNDINALNDQIRQLSNTLEPQATDQGIESPVWDILYALNDGISANAGIIASNIFDPDKASGDGALDPLNQFYVDITIENNIPFTPGQSKYAIPFPGGMTLEWLAQTYLGDATRWLEIAAANNLKAPYIDEDGFINVLQNNGQSREFVINSNENLFIGQTVWLSSNTISADKRTITNIQMVAANVFLVSVNGDADLEKFTTIDGAKMLAYLPNTVNSQKQIFIPVDIPVKLNDFAVKPIPYIEDDPELVKLSLIDFMLDANGDTMITNDGNIPLAFGKANFIQAAVLKAKTAIGKLILHTGFGFGVTPGTSNADLSLTDIKQAAISSFLSDPRFSAVQSIEITIDADILTIKMDVVVAQNKALIPIAFQVKA